MSVPFKSNFTVCDEVGGVNQCVELFFNSNLQLLNVSEPYEAKEGTIPVVHPDGYLVEVVKMSDMTDEQIAALTHNGKPNDEAMEFRPESDAWHLRDASTNESGLNKLSQGQDEPGCTACEQRKKELELLNNDVQHQKATKKNLLSRLAKGVPGLLKSELGINQASLEVVDKRKSICLNCPEGIYNFGVCDEERGGCGCFLASKVTIEGESCPKGHW
jgi:hypothetical protein